MKLFFILALFSCLSFSAKKQVYQVISSHPHDVAEFSAFVTTVKQQGRLWLVEKKDRAPESINKYLLSIQGRDVRSFVPEVTSDKFVPGNELIRTYTSQINSTEIRKSVESLAAYKTRLAGSPDNRKATDAIKAELASLGLSVSTVCYRADTCSVIADKMGSEKPSE